ncbi:hypothetical protein [Streptomyces lunaelactis]|uniref:hypothetical protein n=1 Tax=Streptomyces lunaelactis TaxID=1535768 RepID=UPI001585322F|nr:hypothetical protein [Streptomyces lunaelactis]NUK22247.1 hypothetical protein [Streptomyces lunaelactis]
MTGRAERDVVFGRLPLLTCRPMVPAVLTTAVWTADLPLFLVGGVVSGAAAGTAFKGSVSTVLSLAVPERRGETSSPSWRSSWRAGSPGDERLIGG